MATPTALTRPGSAADAAKPVPLGDPAKALLRPDHSVRQFVDALAAAGEHPDATRVMAFALPKREAVWWAVQVAKLVPELLAGPSGAALAAAEAWCGDPTDDKRRACYEAALKAELATPAACAAMAAFLSEGSMAPPHVAAVPPPPEAGQTTAGNAVVLAAVAAEPEKAGEKLTRFLAVAAEVAAGTNRWAEARPAAPPPAAPPPSAGPGRPPPPPPPPSQQPPPRKSWY